MDSTSSAPCAEGLSIGSTFNLSVPLGWDRIEVTAAGYQANRTWIDVTGSNRTGPIVLASQAIVHGLVLDRNGSGILGAAISYCPVATAVAPNPSCAPLDLPSGTDASGFFSGHLPGAAFPAGSFEIVATASGYFGNWSWVNATPGAIVFAPPIHLTLVGSGAPRAPFGALARPRPSIQGPWVDGRVLDAVTGAGIHGVNLIACPVSSTSSCVSFTDSTSTGGEFNASLTTGAYWLNASETGYADAQIYVNATGTRPVHLGTFLMKPNPLVTGRAVLDPWENESLSSGLGPSGASVSVCNRVGTVCGAGAVLSTAGFFEATGPAGTYDTVAIVGTGGSNFDSLTNTPLEGGAPQGYDPFETSLNVSAPSVSLGLTFSSLPRLAMFSGLSGGALDGSSRTVPGGVPTLPARWASVQVNGTRPNSNFAAVLSGGGRFTLFLPGGEKVRLEAVGSAFRGANATGVAVPTGARTSAVPSFDLPHYGWVESTIHASNGAPIPYAPVSATLADPANGTSLSNSDIADGTGFVNVSAPTQGSDVVRTTPVGYGNSSVRVEVLPSETSPALLPNVAPVSSLTHVESWEVNDVGVPLVTTVVDPTTGAPVPEALIGLSAGGPTSGIEAQVPSNGLGQFLLSAPLSSAPSLVVHATGYSVPRLPVISAPLARIRTLNLTADGILALRVVGLPGPTPLPGANVTACSASYTGPCSTVEANGEGIAWIATPPGLYSITIQAVGYLGNVSYPASTCSDCFDWLGNLTVYADSVVLGRVVDGLFGTPIVGANVTLCPVGGGYAIYCLFPTPTDGLGGFAFPAPAGIYWLNATAADHGLFSLELEVRFGQTIAVGDLALAPDGALSGSVVDGSRSLPIAGAQVFACPIDGSACAGPAVTDPSGRYTIPSVSPGAERLLATALGYASGFGRVLVPPGAA
ncbi:MAG TPA: carboxypeptidase-like regulatory domain-containing protein, partial [Thermoplasmata archaeon]|nr:carboxypeptidase-like regulatory domain-containing protein [Thermoplasmata archaeon]